ncbi:MAG TPA: DUF4412 domain-containing protein [Verrucomicrobiae bacterium]|nr:DUF4412 domain-containing protein [Verrucomicrobiae bacterium]
MAKLFGDNQAFSAAVQSEVKMSGGETISVPGKMSFDSGKSRFEMNMSEAKGSAMPPQMAEQMKTMGMDQMVIISRPEEKQSYMVYPGLKAYAQMPMPEEAAKAGTLKIETTEIGKETVDGHPCVKNKAVVTDEKGTKHESTVWNATDLKNFPVKIETTEQGMAMKLSFKNVKLSKPEASQFNPPGDFKKYDNMMALMQQEVMKRMQQGGGMPAAGE